MAYLLYNVNRLQQIQDGTACIVRNTIKYDYMASVLQNLHWLSVRLYTLKVIPNIQVIHLDTVAGTCVSVQVHFVEQIAG